MANFLTARKTAYLVLNKLNLKKDFASPVLHQMLGGCNQKQRATDLVYGVIRNIHAIDFVIKEFAGCPSDRISKQLINVIRIAAYELIYSPDTAVHAIVHEGVDGIKDFADKKQVGFTNAVCRQIARSISNRQIELSKADIKRTLPQNNEFGCQFNRFFLPDPQVAAGQFLAAVFSLPAWLIEQWLKNFGMEKTKQICFASNRRPSVYLRPNILKTNITKLFEILEQEKFQCQIVQDCLIKVKSPSAISDIPGFNEGLFTVQDLTAYNTIKDLNPQKGWAILDMCSAPGTKTAHIAELTANSATIIATDIDEKRLEKVKANIARLNLTSVKIIGLGDIENHVRDSGLFDCVLIDVPCSNTGVLAKRPEVRHRITKDAAKQIVQTQKSILERASKLIKSGGTVCYSTCSIQPQENGLLVGDFLKENKQFTLDKELLTLPNAFDNDFDGGFYAVLRKK